ncbi:MAG TPA: hypothetical protein PKY31_13800, partial [Spirochaetota bacterium]|nr:hypothetical protein [Spirochaetota bacterium]
RLAMIAAGLVLCAVPARAQWDQAVVEKAVNGLKAVSSSVVSDTFTPMTHYRAGEWSVTAVPAYIIVDRACDDPELEGDDLAGYAGGAGAGYAFTERIMVYVIYAGMRFDGGLRGNGYAGLPLAEYAMDVDYSLHSLFAGAGIDLVGDNGSWSVPLFIGASLQRYDVAVDFPLSYNIVPFPAYSHEARVTGSGFLYGVTAAVAVSRNLGCVRVTPYFLYMRSLNKPELEATVHITQPPEAPFTRDVNAGTVTASMPGLRISCAAGSGWSFFVSAGGFLSSRIAPLGEGLAGGLKVKTIAAGVSYSGGAGRGAGD